MVLWLRSPLKLVVADQSAGLVESSRVAPDTPVMNI